MSFFKIRNKKGFEIISLDDVLYFNSDRNYTTFNFKDKRKIKILCPISKIEEYLKDENFTRVHKKYIIHNKYVRGFDKEICCITLLGGFEIPVSVRKKSCINEIIRVPDIHIYFSEKAKVKKTHTLVR